MRGFSQQFLEDGGTFSFDQPVWQRIPGSYCPDCEGMLTAFYSTVHVHQFERVAPGAGMGYHGKQTVGLERGETVQNTIHHVHITNHSAHFETLQVQSREALEVC